MKNDNAKTKSVSSVNGTDDREARSKFWIALYTRPRSEKKAKAFLDHEGIETYLPIQKQIRQWSDRKKLVEVVVIPMIVFVHIEKEMLHQIINHSLILKPLTLPGSKEVSIIPENQIDKLRFILGQSDYPISFEPSSFHVNDKVRIVRGPLLGLVGDISILGDDYVELAVSVGLKGTARLKIEKINIEILK